MTGLKKKQIRMVITFILIFLLVIFGFLYSIIIRYEERTLPGICLGAEQVGGYTEEQLKEVICDVFTARLNQRFTIKWENKEWQISGEEIGISLDEKATVEKCLGAGKEGNLLDRIIGYFKIRKMGLKIMPQYEEDAEKLQTFLDSLSNSINVEPQNAKFYVGDNGSLTIVSHQEGIIVDQQKTLTEIKKFMSEPWEDGCLNVITAPTLPQYTTEELEAMKIKDKVAEYSTTFDTTQQDRSHNIKIAVKAVDGLIIAPGETFSFNEIVGPRIGENGYKDAPVIVDNKLVSGLGGGVCQVSTTLYNVALLGDFEIIERRNHSLKVGYVPLGRDATVVYGAQDLKFRNNSDKHYYLHGFVKGGRLTFQLYGQKEAGKEVYLEADNIRIIPSPIIYEKDSSILDGKEAVEKGKAGYVVTLWRTVKVNDKIIRKEKISTDRYNPTETVIRQGTAQTEYLKVNPDNGQKESQETELSGEGNT